MTINKTAVEVGKGLHFKSMSATLGVLGNLVEADEEQRRVIAEKQLAEVGAVPVRREVGFNPKANVPPPKLNPFEED
jgi:hypothetical protein